MVMRKVKKSVKVRKPDLADRVIALVEDARKRVVAAANVALVYTYYEVGRMIVEDEQGGKKRAAYGKAQLATLSCKLTARFGKGWSVENLKLMRRFFTVYSNWVNGVYPIAVAGKKDRANQVNSSNVVWEIQGNSIQFRLSWSHYLVLMRIENPDERRFYEIEAAENGWGLEELKRQFKSSLYERLALSRDKNRQIFASKYLTVLPDKEALRRLVKRQLDGKP